MSVMDVAVQETAAAGRRSYAEYDNPQWATLLILPGMDADSVECRAKRRARPTAFRSSIFFPPAATTAPYSTAPPSSIVPLKPDLELFISAMDQLLALVHSSTRFWQDALTLAARAART